MLSSLFTSTDAGNTHDVMVTGGRCSIVKEQAQQWSEQVLWNAALQASCNLPGPRARPQAFPGNSYAHLPDWWKVIVSVQWRAGRDCYQHGV